MYEIIPERMDSEKEFVEVDGGESTKMCKLGGMSFQPSNDIVWFKLQTQTTEERSENR